MRLITLLLTTALLPACQYSDEACAEFGSEAYDIADELLDNVGEIPTNIAEARDFCLQSIKDAGWSIHYKRRSDRNPESSSSWKGKVKFAEGFLDRSLSSQARGVCHEWTHVASELHWGHFKVLVMYGTAKGRAGLEMAANAVEMPLYDATHAAPEKQEAFRMMALTTLEDGYGPWAGKKGCLEDTLIPFWDGV